MRKVLVTGAAGFIASELSLQLINEGIEVVGIDNMNDYYDVTLKEFRISLLRGKRGFTFKKIDIEDKSELSALFESNQFDVIYNLAARAGVRYSMENPAIYYSTNVIGTLNLLDLMKAKGIKKMVLASTSSIYAGQKMPFDESLAVNEPISPYAASKKAAELLCYSYHYLYGMDISVVRYFTVYGPSGRPDMSIFRFIRWINEGKKVEIFGDGNQSRDFTYVDDIARGTMLAGQKMLGYEVINLGGGKNPVTISTVISKLEAYLRKKAIIENGEFHKADIKETWANIDKAKRLLDWEPKISLDEGLKRTVESFRKHKILNEVILPD